MKHYFFVLLTVLLFIHANAQPVADERVMISDPGELYSTFDLNTSSAKGTLKRMFGASYNDMVEHSTEGGWPEGLKTLDTRTDNKSNYEDLVVYKVLEFDTYCLVKIPTAENKSVPADMRAPYDFYMVYSKLGVEAYSAPVVTTGTQLGVPAKLLESGGLRSTFNLATSEFNRSIRRQVGDEYEKIIAHCKEDTWPIGISTMDERDKVRPQMLKYKVWMIAEFDGKYILRIPAAENASMPYNLRPYADIYFVIDSGNVKLLK